MERLKNAQQRSAGVTGDTQDWTNRIGLELEQKRPEYKTNFSRGGNREALELIAWKPVVSSPLKESQILVTL